MPSSPDAPESVLTRRRLLVRSVTPRSAAWSARRELGLGGTTALVVLALVILVAMLGPWLSPYSSIVPSGEPFLPPLSPGHVLGTDNLGLDLATRVMQGARTSILAGFVVTVVAALLGLLIGTLAGFLGGWVDTVLMRLTDLFLAFPATIVAVAIAAGLGPSLTSSMIGISVVWWPLYARLVRGEIRRAVVSPHVEAARLSGTRGFRLARRHVVPTVVPTVVVTASLDIGAVVMVLASLAFIGLGSPSPSPELGLMASSGMKFVLDFWWVAVVPGVAVGVLTLLFTYLGDGARTLLRSKGA